MESVRKEFWETAGGASDFNAEWKQGVLGHIGKVLKQKGLSVGTSILDLGAGIHPVSRFLAPKDARVIYVDFNEPDVRERACRSLHVARDAHDLIDQDSFATKRTLVEASQFFGIDARKGSPEQIDTVIISDLLNYVPAADVLRRAYEHLKENGVMIVLNQPGRTFTGAEHALDPEGATSNEAVTSLLTAELHMISLYESTTKEGYLIAVFQKKKEVDS